MGLEEPGSVTGEQRSDDFSGVPTPVNHWFFLSCETEKEQVTLTFSLSFITMSLCVRYFQHCLAFNPHSSHLECFIVFFFSAPPSPSNPLPIVVVTAKGQIPSREEKQFTSPWVGVLFRFLVYMVVDSTFPRWSPEFVVGSLSLLVDS